MHRQDRGVIELLHVLSLMLDMIACALPRKMSPILCSSNWDFDTGGNTHSCGLLFTFCKLSDETSLTSSHTLLRCATTPFGYKSHYTVPWTSHLANNLHADGALAGNHERIVERVNELATLLFWDPLGLCLYGWKQQQTNVWKQTSTPLPRPTILRIINKTRSKRQAMCIKTRTWRLVGSPCKIMYKSS